jgi:TolB-like protein
MRAHLFPGAEAAQIHSIAVIPLANLSGDSSQDYFADGMTDELITALAKKTARCASSPAPRPCSTLRSQTAAA